VPICSPHHFGGSATNGCGALEARKRIPELLQSRRNNLKHNRFMPAGAIPISRQIQKKIAKER
jgi:hypothetical protein